MNEKIRICKRTAKRNQYQVIETRMLNVSLNEMEMTLYASFNGKPYRVRGNCFWQFIVIED